MDVTLFAGYWIGLGIASSIGLGTGLHTFILYLGPFIAQVTMAANQCNEVPVLMPSRWRFQYFEPCDVEAAASRQMVSFGAIYKAVALEAFLWGFGTAIGELPPYFVAKAASAAGKTHEELEEFLESTQSDDSALSRLKMKGFRFLKRNAFVAVTIAASVSSYL